MEDKKKKYIIIGVIVGVLIIATVLTCSKKGDDSSANASARNSSIVDEDAKSTADASATTDTTDSNDDSNSTSATNSNGSTGQELTEEEWNAMTEEEQAEYVAQFPTQDGDANALHPKYDSAYDANGNKVKETKLADSEYINWVDISNTTPEWNNLTGAAVYVGNLVNKCGYFGRNYGTVKSNYDGWTVTSYENIASENSNFKNLYRLGAYTHPTKNQTMYNIYGTEKYFTNRNANNYIIAAYITVNDDGTAKLRRMYVSKNDPDDGFDYVQILADDGTFDSETIAYLDSGVGTVLE